MTSSRTFSSPTGFISFTAAKLRAARPVLNPRSSDGRFVTSVTKRERKCKGPLGKGLTRRWHLGPLFFLSSAALNISCAAKDLMKELASPGFSPLVWAGQGLRAPEWQLPLGPVQSNPHEGVKKSMCGSLESHRYTRLPALLTILGHLPERTLSDEFLLDLTFPTLSHVCLQAAGNLTTRPPRPVAEKLIPQRPMWQPE